MSKKKVIYIMGAGRSGTTLLDIILGNSVEAFSTGEIIKFPLLKAEPHGFTKESENYRFWKKVEKSFFKKISYNYDFLIKVSRYIESHHRFILNYFNILSKEIIKKYTEYINSLFEAIFENISLSKTTIIDSSKYPGRALALRRFLDYPVYIIYLVRDPRGVITSFSKKRIEQPPKNFLSANLYYFVINTFCNLVRIKLPGNCIIKMRYEELISSPVDTLLRIQEKFCIDLTIPIKKIKNNEPLSVGFLFEGNRIRLKRSIILERKSIRFPKTTKYIITYLLNKFWY